jgi:hypothetical protein
VLLKGNETMSVPTSKRILMRARVIAADDFLKQLGVHATLAVECTASNSTTSLSHDECLGSVDDAEASART